MCVHSSGLTPKDVARLMDAPMAFTFQMSRGTIRMYPTIWASCWPFNLCKTKFYWAPTIGWTYLDSRPI